MYIKRFWNGGNQIIQHLAEGTLELNKSKVVYQGEQIGWNRGYLIRPYVF